MKNLNKTAFAIGTSIAAGFGSTVVIAAENPFEVTELSAGYMIMAEADTDQGEGTKAKDGSCGEGKCGNKVDEAGDGDKGKEGTCGDKKMDEDKLMEGKCGDKK